MAEKISQMTELAATPDDGDLLHIIDDPSGTPDNKRITVANLLGAVPRLISTHSGSSGSQVDISIPGGFTDYLITGRVLPSSDDADLFARFDVGAGVDSGNNYHRMGEIRESDGSNFQSGSASSSGISVSIFGQGNATNENMYFDLRIPRAHDNAYTHAFTTATPWIANSNAWAIAWGGGVHAVSGSLQTVRLYFDGAGGNFADYAIRLIGYP